MPFLIPKIQSYISLSITKPQECRVEIRKKLVGMGDFNSKIPHSNNRQPDLSNQVNPRAGNVHPGGVSHKPNVCHPTHCPIDLSSRNVTPEDETTLLSKGPSFVLYPETLIGTNVV